MKKYAIYENSGTILRVVTCPSSQIEYQTQGDEKCIECHDGVSDSTHWVNESGVLEDKPRMNVIFDKAEIAADGVDTAIASDIPVGAIVIISGAGSVNEMVVDDGILEITVDTVGEYQITIKSFPYLDHTEVINGTN